MSWAELYVTFGLPLLLVLMAAGLSWWAGRDQSLEEPNSGSLVRAARLERRKKRSEEEEYYRLLEAWAVRSMGNRHGHDVERATAEMTNFFRTTGEMTKNFHPAPHSAKISRKFLRRPAFGLARTGTKGEPEAG